MINKMYQATGLSDIHAASSLHIMSPVMIDKVGVWQPIQLTFTLRQFRLYQSLVEYGRPDTRRYVTSALINSSDRDDWYSDRQQKRQTWTFEALKYV